MRRAVQEWCEIEERQSMILAIFSPVVEFLIPQLKPLFYVAYLP